VKPPRTFCYAYGLDGKVQYGKLGEPAYCPGDPSRNAYEDLFSARSQLEHDERVLAVTERRDPREVFAWPFDKATDTFTAADIGRAEKLRRKGR
jgi:hypothetical protein